MRPSAGLAAVAAFVTAGASGCGWLAAPRPLSADPGEPRLSHAALVARAEAACTTRSRALAALPRPRTKKQAPAFFARVAAIARAEHDTLSALRPPRRDEPEHARLVAATREIADLAAGLPAAGRGAVAERHEALAAADRASERYDRAAARLGLRCRQSA